MAGSPLISVANLEHDFNQLLQENPQLQQIITVMPDARYNFLQGMVSQAVVDRYVADNRLRDKKEYQEEKKRLTQSVEKMLNTKYFNMEHPVEVADAEVTKFYDENKKVMPELLLDRGGVKAVGISFHSHDEAKAFAAKAKGQDLVKAAKASGLASKVHDFKLVNAQSAGMDNAVRNKIAAMTRVPAVDVVKGEDNSFWVVHATERRDAKYRPLDEQVKAGLKQYIEKEKRVAILDKEIAKLKEKYHVVVNEAYFKPQQQDQTATAQAQQPAEAATAHAEPAAKAA